MNPEVRLNVVIQSAELEPVLAVIQRVLQEGLANRASVQVERQPTLGTQIGAARYSAIRGL